MFLDIDDFMRAAFVIQLLCIGIIRSMFAGLQIGETKGRKYFGDEYRQYMARTSRFLPFSSRREPPAF